MKHKYNRLLMGTAVGVAAIAAAIDHTKHRLPEPELADVVIIQDDDESASPCSLNIEQDSSSSPCSLN